MLFGKSCGVNKQMPEMVLELTRGCFCIIEIFMRPPAGGLKNQKETE
jgi:hypothetical protein